MADQQTPWTACHQNGPRADQLSGSCTYGWRGACIVPLYKGKGDKCECSNSRGISLLSVVVKLYGRVLIKRVKARTECAIGEGQCGFWQSRGCMDKVFAIRQVCEKYAANGKDVFWAFMDLEKAYDVIDQHGMCRCLECVELEENCRVFI